MKSKLEELIEKLCPNGVEWKELSIILDYEQPTKYILKDTNYNDNYKIPVLTAGQSFILGYTNETTGIYEANKENPVIIFDDFTTSFHWVDFNFKIKSSAMKLLKVKKEKVDKVSFRFIYHCMKNICYTPADHSRQWIGKYSKIEIPVPPLEIQEEIVRILDKFTKLTTEIQTELTTELTLRKQQYEYYRDKLLKNNIPNKKLKDIVDIYLGLTYKPTYIDNGVKFISSQNISNDYLDLSNIKYISYEEYTKITKNAKPKKGDILFTRVGSNLGHPVIIEVDLELCIFVSLGYLRVKEKEKVLNTYIKHWMNTKLFWKQVDKKVYGSAKINLNTSWLKEFEIFIPPLEEQKRIVEILDRFDKYINDIKEGLPAEIEMRQKQYEYYRDKLLNLKKLDIEG